MHILPLVFLGPIGVQVKKLLSEPRLGTILEVFETGGARREEDINVLALAQIGGYSTPVGLSLKRGRRAINTGTEKRLLNKADNLVGCIAYPQPCAKVYSATFC